jgi:hypothetical protein
VGTDLCRNPTLCLQSWRAATFTGYYWRSNNGVIICSRVLCAKQIVNTTFNISSDARSMRFPVGSFVDIHACYAISWNAVCSASNICLNYSLLFIIVYEGILCKVEVHLHP